MSFATDTLALAKLAYQKALSGQTVQFDNRRWSPHNIDQLLTQVKHWQAQVDSETARSAGRASRGPFRFTL